MSSICLSMWFQTFTPLIWSHNLYVQKSWRSGNLWPHSFTNTNLKLTRSSMHSLSTTALPQSLCISENYPFPEQFYHLCTPEWTYIYTYTFSFETATWINFKKAAVSNFTCFSIGQYASVAVTQHLNWASALHFFAYLEPQNQNCLYQYSVNNCCSKECHFYHSQVNMVKVQDLNAL